MTDGIDDAMDRLLDDWGWWARARNGSGYRCRSIEGRYMPERVPGDEDRNPRRVVDEQACLEVERVVCAPGFPVIARLMLKCWYVLRISREKITGKAGIPRAGFHVELARSVTMLKNNLDKKILLSIIAATNPTDRDDFPAYGGVRTTRETQARLA